MCSLHGMWRLGYFQYLTWPRSIFMALSRSFACLERRMDPHTQRINRGQCSRLWRCGSPPSAPSGRRLSTPLDWTHSTDCWASVANVTPHLCVFRSGLSLAVSHLFMEVTANIVSRFTFRTRYVTFLENV